MTDETNLRTLISELERFERSGNYSDAIYTLTTEHDKAANGIIEDWTKKQTLSADKKQYINIYSNTQISFVKYYVFNWLKQDNVETISQTLQARLIQKKQLKTIQNAIEFIEEEHANEILNKDPMLVYIMRMIDARSCAYPLLQTSSEDNERIKDFYETIRNFLTYKNAKKYLFQIDSTKPTKNSTSLDYVHQFSMGCCTFAIARFPTFKGTLNTDEHDLKYVYVLVKYVRLSLEKTDFDQNKASQYCVRGILTLLTNYALTGYWLDIMNRALADTNNDDLQEKNPFNINLFTVIINKILDSDKFKEIAFKSGSNDESLLLDSTIVFLVRWSDIQTDFKDDINDKSSSTSNQLIHLFNTHEGLKNISKIMIPYIHAKYDRLFLMAISLLSNIMSAEDFANIQKTKETMPKDLLDLLFKFIRKAKEQHDGRFKGIPYGILLTYLHQFLIQDFIKKEALNHLSEIVQYARNKDLIALKILRRISTDPELIDDITKNKDLQNFLNVDANVLYQDNDTFCKVIKSIRENITPLPTPEPVQSLPNEDNEINQAFISYCHADEKICQSIHKNLKTKGFFSKFWIDKDDMRDNMVDTATKGVIKSKVVFVLLSDSYCASDFCRKEWTFAIKKKIKTYVLFVQPDFDRNKYDWVVFKIEDDLFYKIDSNGNNRKLFDDLDDFLKKKTTAEKKPQTSLEKLEVSKNKDYLRKPMILTWTYDDIDNWCLDHNLDQWRSCLKNFDGASLLVLYYDVLNDDNLKFFINGNNLTIFDIARFKSEMKMLLEKQRAATETKPATKKHMTHRRISKGSMK